MLISFDQMALECLDENSALHIREAARCYEGGAYRAAIIATYVAVCFDLISKLKALEADGDAAAKTLLATLAAVRVQQDKNDPAAIPALLAFERNLLEEFRDKFDFFGTNEFDELARLRADRNRCAHPTFLKSDEPYSPSAELARLHIRNAIKYVLSQQPKQGKAALATLQSIVLGSYFPDAAEAAATRLKGSPLGTAKEALVKAFVDELAFGWPTPTSPYYHKTAALNALTATVELHRTVALPRLITAIDKLFASGDDEGNKMGAYASLWVIEAGEAINAASRAVLTEWLKKEQGLHLGSTLKRAMRLGWLAPFAKSHVKSLTAEQIGAITNGVPAEIVSRAAELYATAGNWTVANSVAAHCVTPNAAKFSLSDLALIFTNATNGKADILGSHSFNPFVLALYEHNPLGKAAITKLLDDAGLSAYAIP